MKLIINMTKQEAGLMQDYLKSGLLVMASVLLKDALEEGRIKFKEHKK